MRVTRFCSRKEYDAFMRGETLTNDINHYRDGKGGSRSVGFCFMAEDPKECWIYLKGIVVPEVCMVLDFPDGYLTKSVGRYADHNTSNGSMMKTEYCTTRYDNKTATLVRVVPAEEYADEADLKLMKAFPELFLLKKSETEKISIEVDFEKELTTNIINLIASYSDTHTGSEKIWIAHIAVPFEGETENAHRFLDDIMPTLHSVVDTLSSKMGISECDQLD